MWRDEGLDELLSHARGEVGSERFRAEIRRKHEERLGHLGKRAAVEVMGLTTGRPPAFCCRNYSNLCLKRRT